METQILIKIISSLLLILIGLMARFSINDGWSPAKKYWLLFIILGTSSLIYSAYKLIQAL